MISARFVVAVRPATELDALIGIDPTCPSLVGYANIKLDLSTLSTATSSACTLKVFASSAPIFSAFLCARPSASHSLASCAKASTGVAMDRGLLLGGGCRRSLYPATSARQVLYCRPQPQKPFLTRCSPTFDNARFGRERLTFKESTSQWHRPSIPRLRRTASVLA